MLVISQFAFNEILKCALNCTLSDGHSWLTLKAIQSNKTDDDTVISLELSPWNSREKRLSEYKITPFLDQLPHLMSVRLSFLCFYYNFTGLFVFKLYILVEILQHGVTNRDVQLRFV